MKLVPIFLIIFGITLLVFPDLVGYILGTLVLMMWVSGLAISNIFKKAKWPNPHGEDYVQFGKYKIFK